MTTRASSVPSGTAARFRLLKISSLAVLVGVLSGIAAEDIGRCAYGIFKREREFIGKTVGIAGEHLTGAQMAAAFGRALGKDGSQYVVAVATGGGMSDCVRHCD